MALGGVVRPAHFACGVVIVHIVVAIVVAKTHVHSSNEMEPNSNYIYYNFVRRLYALRCLLPNSTIFWNGELMPTDEHKTVTALFGFICTSQLEKGTHSAQRM